MKGGLMAFFKKSPLPCPICGADLNATNKVEHWETHVRVIPEGQGDASGQFTWVCKCGPAGYKWPKSSGASAGLALHMSERHSISLL